MNQSGQYTWHKIADCKEEISFSENGMTEIKAGGKNICLIRNKDILSACSAKCPHAGGHLSDGYVDALGNIICPLHRYKFSLQNGRNISGEGYFLKTFPVEIREDGVFVGIEEKNSLFGW